MRSIRVPQNHLNHLPNVMKRLKPDRVPAGYDADKGANEAGLSSAASASVATVITKPEELDNFSSGFGNLPLPNSAPGGTSPASLTHRLENALGTTAPLLKVCTKK